MKQLYTRKQFAALLNVTPKTVYSLEKKALIVPATHINGRPRYTQESIVENQKKGGRPDGIDSN